MFGPGSWGGVRVPFAVQVEEVMEVEYRSIVECGTGGVEFGEIDVTFGEGRRRREWQCGGGCRRTGCSFSLTRVNGLFLLG